MSETSSGLSGLSAGLVPFRDRRPRSGFANPRFVRGAVLACADLTAVEFAFLIASFAVVGLATGWHVSALPNPALAAVSALCTLASGFCLGLYDTPGRHPAERFRLRVWGALMLPWIGFGAVATAEGRVTLADAATLAVTAALSLAIAPVAEACARMWLTSRSAWNTKAVLIGSHAATAGLAAQLLADPGRGLSPVGFFGDDCAPDSLHPLPHLGRVRDAERRSGVAELAVVAISPDHEAPDLARLAFRQILVVPDASGVPALHVRSLEVGGRPGLAFSNRAQVMSNSRVKRSLELCLAVPLLVLCLPLMAMLAMAIKIVSPGPAFYVQRRVGWKGKSVRILKLRSMHVDAEARLQTLLAQDPAARAQWATHVKLSPDPRVLPVIGTFIRRTSLDELPQLLNVVRGDIGLVGPRPFPSYHLEKFDPEFRAFRASVRPGLTGLWQVSARSDADIAQQQSIDTFYIRNWSLWLDLYILLQTVPAMISARGAR